MGITLPNLSSSIWEPRLINCDDGLRLIGYILQSGRKGNRNWPLFSIVINPNLGLNDPAIPAIKDSLKLYTLPNKEKLTSELESVLYAIYKEKIYLHNSKL
jgi:hypothetical protein